MLRRLLLLLPLLAAAATDSRAADELDGLDHTMQVLDDVAALQSILTSLPTTQDLQRTLEPEAPVKVELESQQSFDSDYVIEEDEMLTEDDFEQGEDIDDDRYDDL